MSAFTHAGNLTPRDAWRLLAEEHDAVLVDVRTPPECTFVGLPDLSRLGKKPVLVPWNLYPGGRNPEFAKSVSAAVADREAPLLFICRSGKRSDDAARAMTAAGFRRCYNVDSGFEGDKDADGHRGRVNGWKVDGLPWTQD